MFLMKNILYTVGTQAASQEYSNLRVTFKILKHNISRPFRE